MGGASLAAIEGDIMKEYKVAIIGFGNVGQGFANILKSKSAVLSETFGVEVKIVAICDLFLGSIADEDGLKIDSVMAHLSSHSNLKQYPSPQAGWTAIETIDNSRADILVELAYTDLKTGEPAYSHIKQALNNRMHVSMTNKGPVALFYPELRDIANKNGVKIGIEGTVMSGTPALTLGQESLLAAGISKIEGIFNGTTNYILGEMEQGMDFDAALKQAQELGYAEAEPSGDVDGHDAAAKVVILANLMMGTSLTLDDVSYGGISKITAQDIKAAREAKKHWKLLGKVECRVGEVHASVQLTMIDGEHPLANVGGATNAITYSTELLGDVTLIGAGAGRLETGYAVLEDILNIHRSH